MFFVGNVKFEPWEHIQKSWASPWSKFSYGSPSITGGGWQKDWHAAGVHTPSCTCYVTKKKRLLAFWLAVYLQDRCSSHNHMAAENWTIGGLAEQDDEIKVWWQEAERALDKLEIESFQFTSDPRSFWICNT